MEFNTKFAMPEKHQVACVGAGVFESRKLSDAADALDKAAHGQIRELLRSGDMDGKMGSTRLLYRVPGIAAERVLLVGLGREKEFGEKQYRDCARAALAAVQETGARDACLYFAELHVPDRDAAWKARQLVLGVGGNVAVRPQLVPALREGLSLCAGGGGGADAGDEQCKSHPSIPNVRASLPG